MNLDLASEIEAWFEALSDSGEFVRIPHGYPYSVVGPTNDRRIFYTTKPNCLGWRPNYPQTAAFIGQGGLPNRNDLEWIERLVGDRDLVFLGDCDPPALLIYAWLRTQRSIRFYGVSDKLLSQLQVTHRDRILIPLAADEAASMPLINRTIPDLKSLIGPNCYDMLQSGHKIEVEGAFNFAGVEPQSVLVSDEVA